MKKTFVLIAAFMLLAFVAIVRVTAVSASDRPGFWEIDVHGFVSQGYMNSERYNYILNNSKGGSFQFNEIGINFSKELTDKLRIGLQILSRDLGDLYNNDLELDWAYADYRWKDWMGLRAGLLKIPNGLYNEARDIDMLRTCILLPSGVYHESFREIYMGLSGVGIYGNVSIGAAGALDYQLLMGTENIDAEDSGIVKDIEDNVNREIPIGSNFKITDFEVEEFYCASLQWHSPWGLRLGGTWKILDFDADGEYNPLLAPTTTVAFTTENYDVKNYTLSAEYTWEDLILAAEYWYLEFKTKANLSGPPPFYQKSTTKKEGWYVSASYRVNEWFECGAYYSEFFPDADDHNGSDPSHNYTNSHEAWSDDIAVSARFDINEYWTFKMEGHKIDGKGVVLAVDNDDYANSNGDFYVFVSKITFSF